MNPQLFAEELDNLSRVSARLAERDPAVLSQLELFALQHHLQLALDGDEVPFVLWSRSMNLSWRRSIVQCCREAL